MITTLITGIFTRFWSFKIKTDEKEQIFFYHLFSLIYLDYTYANKIETNILRK